MNYQAYRWDVTYGEKPAYFRREGESLRAFYERSGNLHLRGNGSLDMRYRTSRILAAER